MFPSKHTIARMAGGIAVAASLVALSASAAFGGANPYDGHDPWYSYASSVTRQATGPVASRGHDPWYRNAVSLTRQQASVPFITDTLSPGGSAPVQGYRFITDTLSPGGSAPVQGYRFITDTLSPGGGASLVAAPTSPGFSWGDAGIGAGSAAALLFLLGGMLLVAGHRRTLAI